MTGHSPSQPKVEPVRRIGIVWEQGAYYVSAPNWNGGEVVLASDYDNLRAKVDELTAALRADLTAFQVILSHGRDNPETVFRIAAEREAALAVNSQHSDGEAT